ncbi:MAG: TIR domain-containing protein [Candidatus Thiodiazotropha sp. (ex Lucinoma borealis)]|nr:TIR domain-containing protein [Candidatus Thiodiazotropha sp. (ex Lucinoma borealis)]
MRSVFFSFSFDDVFKVNQVRKSGTFSGAYQAGFRDRAEYKKIAKGGEVAVKHWIDSQIRGCSVTCVLIGRGTYNSKWVNYEIQQSIINRMGLLGIYIHKLNDPTKPQDTGFLDPPNPLDKHQVSINGLFGTSYRQASEVYETYTWCTGLLGAIGNDIRDWIEIAASRAGR